MAWRALGVPKTPQLRPHLKHVGPADDCRTRGKAMGTKIEVLIGPKRSINRSRRLDKSSLGTQNVDFMEVRTCLTRRQWPRSARRIIKFASRKPPGLAVDRSCGWGNSSSGFGSGATAGGSDQPLCRRSGREQRSANPMLLLFVKGNQTRAGAVFRWKARKTASSA